MMLDHNHDGINRRGLLTCMDWAGTGLSVCCEVGSSNRSAWPIPLKSRKQGARRWFQLHSEQSPHLCVLLLAATPDDRKDDYTVTEN
jgi:hypothetical protein